MSVKGNDLGKSKKFKRLAGCEMKIMCPIAKMCPMFIYQSKAKLDEKILCGKITYLWYSKIGRKLVRDLHGNGAVHGPFWSDKSETAWCVQ